jgi:hypothetical protein
MALFLALLVAFATAVCRLWGTWPLRSTAAPVG